LSVGESKRYEPPRPRSPPTTSTTLEHQDVGKQLRELDRLAKALKPDWHEAHCAGRTRRHVDILRDVAHELSNAPDRVDLPKTAAEAQTRFQAYLERLSSETGHAGLASPTRDLVEHIKSAAARAGLHLFYCFDDPRIPGTTNKLEGFFGWSKHFERQVTGNASTTNCLVQNLGADHIMTVFEVKNGTSNLKLETLQVDYEAFKKARAEIEAKEAPARQRRSFVRRTSDHVAGVVARFKELLGQA
jgi:hypothetical protein